MHLQGGRKAANSVARTVCLGSQALDMIAEMRGQFAAMLAESGFIRPPEHHNRRDLSWIDEPKAVWNAHANRPAVVSAQAGLSSYGELTMRGLHTVESR